MGDGGSGIEYNGSRCLDAEVAISIRISNPKSQIAEAGKIRRFRLMTGHEIKAARAVGQSEGREPYACAWQN